MKSWCGLDGEAQMTKQDWIARGTEQAIAMLNGCDAFESSPDEDGIATGGCYNGDYPESWHDECNRRLIEDEYYEASVDQQMQELYNLCERPSIKA